MYVKIVIVYMWLNRWFLRGPEGSHVPPAHLCILALIGSLANDSFDSAFGGKWICSWKQYSCKEMCDVLFFSLLPFKGKPDCWQFHEIWAIWLSIEQPASIIVQYVWNRINQTDSQCFSGRFQVKKCREKEKGWGLDKFMCVLDRGLELCDVSIK